MNEMTFDEAIEALQHAVYGEEVRYAIARALVLSMNTQQSVAGKEDASNKVVSMDSNSTDIQYPSAKSVYDALSGKENSSNKKTTLTGNESSNDFYPSIKAVVDYLAANYLGSGDNTVSWANLAAAVQTVINGKESASNKLSSEAGIDEDSTDTEYPSAKAVFNFGGHIVDILNEVDTRLMDIDGKESLELERGNITISGTSLTFRASTTRLRTPESGFDIEIGDIVSIDTANAEYYIAIQVGENRYWYNGWGSADYVSTQSGKAWVLARKSPETTTVVGDITFTLTRAGNLPERVTALEAEMVEAKADIQPASLINPLLDASGYVNSIGGISQDTQSQSEHKSRHSVRIGVEASQKYILQGWVATDGGIWNSVATFTNEDVLISRNVGNEATEVGEIYKYFLRTITMPSNCAYVIVSSWTYGEAYFSFSKGETPKASLDYVKAKILSDDRLMDYADTKSAEAISEAARYSDGKDNDYFKRIIEQRSSIKSIAHRGNMTSFQNTFPAFKDAVGKGFTYIETDVRFTMPDSANPLGVPVLLHDVNINSMAYDANGNSMASEPSIPINSITYAEVLEYDFGAANSGVKIASFEDFVIWCKRVGVKPYFDLKVSTRSEIELLIEIVNKYNMSANVTWVCPASSTADYIFAEQENARCCLLLNTLNLTAIQWFNTKKGSNLNAFAYMNRTGITDESIETLIENEIEAETFTYDSALAVLSVNPYFSGILTNGVLASYVIYNSAMT